VVKDLLAEAQYTIRGGDEVSHSLWW